METLSAVAPEVAQRRQCGRSLDPLRDHVQSEVVAELDDRTDQRRIAAVQIRDETRVDLDLVDRQLAQIGQRGVPGPEVVDAESHPQMAESVQRLECPARIIGELPLGQLEAQRPGREPGAIQQVGDPADQHRIVQVATGQVDTDPEFGRSGQMVQIGGRSFRHQAGQCCDGARHLRQLDELPRRQKSSAGVLPAHECLDPESPERLQIDTRLIVHDHLIGLHGLPQFRQQLELGPAAQILTCGVPDDAAASGLGPVHGAVGMAHQRRAVGGMIGEHRDTDAGSDAESVLVDLEGLTGQLAHTFRHLVRGGASPGSREEDGELVASESGDDVAVAQVAGEAAGQIDQQTVAVLVPERVVDLLELVQVHHDQRRLGSGTIGAVSCCPCQRCAQPLVEMRPVGEPGEVVVHGLMAKGLRDPGPFGHVLQRDPDALVRQGEGAQRVDPVLHGEIDRRALERGVQPHHVGEVLEQLRVRVEQVAEPAADHLLAHQPDELDRRRVPDDHPDRPGVVQIVEAQDGESDGDALDEVRVAADRALGLGACGLVDHDASSVPGPSVGILRDHDAFVQVPGPTSRIADPVVDLDVGALGDAPATVDQRVDVVGVHVAGQEREVTELGRGEPQQVDHPVADVVGVARCSRRLPDQRVDPVDEFVVAIATLDRDLGDVRQDHRAQD